LKRKILKNPLEGTHENVWGPRENVSPSPAVALDGPERKPLTHVRVYRNSVLIRSALNLAQVNAISLLQLDHYFFESIWKFKTN